MLDKALSYCLQEDYPQTFVQIFENIDLSDRDKERLIIKQQQEVFMEHVRNPYLKLEDHQRGLINQDNIKELLTRKQAQEDQIINISSDTGNQDEQLFGNYNCLVDQQNSQTQFISKNQIKAQFYNHQSQRSQQQQEQVNKTDLFLKTEIHQPTVQIIQIQSKNSPYGDGWSQNVLNRFYQVKVKSNSKILFIKFNQGSRMSSFSYSTKSTRFRSKQSSVQQQQNNSPERNSRLHEGKQGVVDNQTQNLSDTEFENNLEKQQEFLTSRKPLSRNNTVKLKKYDLGASSLVHRINQHLRGNNYKNNKQISYIVDQHPKPNCQNFQPPQTFESNKKAQSSYNNKVQIKCPKDYLQQGIRTNISNYDDIQIEQQMEYPLGLNIGEAYDFEDYQN